jgi:hypothetical protein
MNHESVEGGKTMKRKSLSAWVGLVVLVALVLVPGSAAARASRVEFSAIEVPTGPPVDHGDWTELPSGNIHVRGMASVYQEVATDPRISGLNTVVMNANWGPDFAGPMWGTSENVLADSADCPGGGIWQGNWTGMMNADGSYSYHAVLQGVSGCVAGLHASLIAFNPGGEALTTFTGEILDPHGE